MQKRFLLSFIGILTVVVSFSQQLALYECGLVNVYDANGNRKIRMWFCNNGQGYPSRIVKETNPEELKTAGEVQIVDALYPNPTTSKFVVTFSKELKNAKVILMDINGKIVQRQTSNGFSLNFDLSALANGVYLVRIENEGNVFTKKVIKQ